MSKSLSIFYILRNEQDYIYKSLKSIETIADEIIIIDTGSIDRTIEICGMFDTKIYKYRWDNDFSGARNFGLSKCTKDYILYLNADEIINESGIENITKLLNKPQDNIVFSFQIDDCLGDWANDNLSKLSQNYTKSPQLRMFPNNKQILFKGRVLESIDDSVYNSSNCSVFNSGVTISHHVFRGNPVKNRKIKEMYYASLATDDKKKQEVKKMSSIDIKMEEEFVEEKCAIIIATFNIPSITKRCLDSIYNNTRYPYKIFIVDNGSDDKTKEFLNSLENVEIIQIGHNSGVAKARNIGVNKALTYKDISYICFLDNDTEVYENWLTKLIEHYKKYPTCGMVGPITTSAIGAQNLVKTSWVGRYTNDEIINLLSNRGPLEYQSTNYLNRFCLLIHRDTCEKIGFFDESFGLIGWEDQDYCKRISNAGYRLDILKTVFVYHKGHSTSAHNGMSYFKLLQESTKIYHEKWDTKRERTSEGYGKKKRSQDIKETPYTSIVVLTYNNLAINSRFVDAIKKFTANYELIVVDNGSTDGTIEYLESLKDNIILIKNGKNLGIPKARNIGLNKSVYDYLICLDNDQIVRENWLVELHNEMENDCDFVGVEAWKVNQDYAPIVRHVCRKPGMIIDYVGAGGCLMKRSVLEDIGIYDERFSPAYYEDVEICFRAKERGYKIGWCDKPIINHLEHSTLIKGQKDFKYNEALSRSHRLFVEKMSETKKGVKHKEYPLMDKFKGEKLVTFCMCLKDRSSAALESIETLVNKNTAKYFNFIIVEDVSNNMLDLSNFSYKNNIDHYIVDTGVGWSRSRLLNYGFKRSSTKFVSAWDADFLFPSDYYEKIYKILLYFDPKNILQVDSRETAECYINGKKFKKGDLYGGTYFYGTEFLKSVKGFDERFLDWGKEERDFENRYFNKSGGSIIMASNLMDNLYIRHKSHGDGIRKISSHSSQNTLMELESRDKKLLIVNRTWGEQKRIS